MTLTSSLNVSSTGALVAIPDNYESLRKELLVEGYDNVALVSRVTTMGKKNEGLSVYCNSIKKAEHIAHLRCLLAGRGYIVSSVPNQDLISIR